MHDLSKFRGTKKQLMIRSFLRLYVHAQFSAIFFSAEKSTPPYVQHSVTVRARLYIRPAQSYKKLTRLLSASIGLNRTHILNPEKATFQKRL
jgi:hypothetical protein